MANIKIENLTAKYKNKNKYDVVAIDNLSLELKDSSLNVIVGYSGCGKTTLLRCIAGLMDYEGYIYFNNVDVIGLPASKRNISMVTQNYILYRTMTIFENIAFPLKIAGASKEEIIERVNSVAKKLEIEHCLTRKPKHLSGGQQQRVALARALIKKPDLYLFDEPLSNLDVPKRTEARLLIKKIIQENNATAIYVTHDLKEALALADHLIVMNKGKIEIEGKPMDIYNSNNPIVESLKGEIVDETIFSRNDWYT